MTILHSADWHLDSPFSSFSQEQREMLKRAQRKLPGKIADICRREGCALVLLAGDLFDGEPCRETVDAVKRALADCAVPVFIAPGNHDHCGPGSVWQEEIWPENVYIFTGGLESVAVPQLNCRVYGAGYRSMDCPPLLEGFRASGEEKFAVGVLHGDPVTKNSPYCPVTAQQIRESGLDYLALGHIHKAGMFRGGTTVCAWPGCPMGRGWDETGEKGICVVTLEETAEVQFIPMDMPRFYDLEAEASENAAAVVEALLPPVETDDFYRIRLTGEKEEEEENWGFRFDACPNLELRDLREPKLALWTLVEEDSLRGVYFRKLQELAGTDERALLAAEISRRILMGRQVPLP